MINDLLQNKTAKEKANLKVLELAAWLHDIAIVDDKANHEITGSKFSQQFLTKLNLNKEIIQAVVTCIKNHRFSKNCPVETLEEKILQDADKLESMGAIGIARLFRLSGRFGQTMHDPKIKPDFNHYLKHGRSNTTINHFYDKMFKLKDLLHTKTARQIAQKREKFMREYLKRFYLEWEGK